MAIDPASREMLLARAEARLLLQRRQEGLLDFIPRVSPLLEAPRHLARFVEVLERAEREPLRIVVAAPPQHGKTETTKHGIVRMMMRRPQKRFGYVTYQAHRAKAVSREMQGIATAAGLSWQGSRDLWYTGDGGGLLASGIGGALTGFGFDGTLVVDDPFKNRREADSAVLREHVYTWFTSTAMTRVHPTASVVIMATRWHPDDLSGRQIAKGWEVINLPAIDDEGHALWEARRPLAWLEQQREEIGEYDWNALYQGQPRNRGDAVFGEPAYYDALPAKYRVSIGADFAYSTNSYADYSVAVVLAQDVSVPDGDVYVLDVVRCQAKAPDFAARLKALATAHGARVTAFIGGTEKAIVDFMSQQGVRVTALPATADKFARAQPVAARWNAGKILVPSAKALKPEESRWVEVLTSELGAFTGVKDRHDDQVDALAGAFHPFAPVRGASGKSTITTSTEYEY